MSRFELSYLGARFDLLDGSRIQASPDASHAWEIPREIEISTELPGGFGPAHVVLPRPDDWDPLRGGLFGDCEIFDHAGRIIYQGRVSGLPHSGANEITVECEGWSKHLEDNATAKALFVDMDMGAWGGLSTALRLVRSGSGWSMGEGSVAPDASSGEPELWQAFTSDPSSTQKPYISNVYRSPAGLPIGSCYYAWKRNVIDNSDTAYVWLVDSYTDDADEQKNDTTSNLRAAGPSSGTLTVSAGNRNLVAEWDYAQAGSGWDDEYAIVWTQLVVYGRHGLTKQGSESYTSHKGLYVSDMVDYIVDTYGPQLAITTGNLEATTYVVPHAVFREDQTPRSIIESLLLLGGSTTEPLNWAVWEDKQFHMWTPSDQGTDWRVRSDTGGSSGDQGYDVQERPNGVKVSFNDGTSIPRSIGPVGSGADVEDDTYTLITDPNHPANLAGIDKWDVVDIGMNSQDGAEMLAQLYLAEKNRNEWRGAITQQGPIKTSAGNSSPPYMVRAGDRVVVETDLDTRSRYITGTTYNTSSRTVSMTISPSVKRFEVLLARLQAAMVGIASGAPHVTPAAAAAVAVAPIDYGVPAQFEHMGR